MYWEFTITHFELGKTDTSFSFTAVPTKKDASFDITQCDEITVDGNYDYRRWKSYKTFMSEQKHIESMQMLKNASRTQNTILFGEMGSGLEKVNACHYKSKGLFHGGNVVMSVYHKI